MDTAIGSFASATGNLNEGGTAVLEPEKKEVVIDKSAEEASRIAAEKSAADKKQADEAEKAKKESAASLANPNLVEKEEKPVVVETEEKKPKGMTDEAWVSWKNIRAEAKTAKADAAAARAELEENKKRLGEIDRHSKEAEELRKDNEALKKSIADYESEISVVRVEKTAKYKNEVTAPQARISSQMAEMAKRYDIPEKTLMEAIQEPDAAKRSDLITEAIADFKLPDQHKVVQAEERWQELQEKAAGFRTDAAKQLEEIERESKGNEEAQRVGIKKGYDSAFQAEWEKALTLTPKVKKVDGAEGWNKHLDSIAQEGMALDPNDVPVETLAKLNASALLLPKVIESLTHLDSEVVRLKGELAAEKHRNKEYRSTELKAGAGGSGESGEGKGASSFAEAVYP